MNNISYDVIGNKINLRVSIGDMTERDKVDLCQHLLEDLGILERFRQQSDETYTAQLIMVEQFQLAWDK